MIVGIVKIGLGLEPLEEFRNAVDEATAVSAFCNEHTPPLDTADYTGLNGDSLDLQKKWNWDFSESTPIFKEDLESYIYEIQYDVNEHVGEKDFLDINYKSELKTGIGYTPVFTINNTGILSGLLEKTEYYRDYIDEDNKGTLVLVVEETYIIDESDSTINNSGKPAVSRDKKWKHVKKKSGQIDESNTKIKPKIYNTRIKRGKEGQKRRGNIIDQLIDNVGLAGIISGIFIDEADAHIKLTDLLTNHNPAFSAWRKSSRGSLYDDIAADTTAWLLNTVSNTANQPAPYNSAAPIAVTSVSHMQDLVLRDYIVSKLKGDVK
jgi:hypothetical protein